MKIRFYHRWIYLLFQRFWNPIFAAKPAMARKYIESFMVWLDKQETKGAK